jgi:outer membrane lipoprotein carrier protein
MKSLIILFSTFFIFGQTKTTTKKTNPLKGYNLPDSQLSCLKIQSYYNSIKTFKSSFKQVFTKRFHGAQKPETGLVFIKKPGKMMWQYLKPEKKLFIVNNKKVWIYEPANKQAIWSDIKSSSLPAPVKFLWGKGNLIGEFNVKLLHKSKFAVKGTKVLKLVPKKRSPHYRSVLFVFTAKGAVLQSIVYDHSGNKNQIIFSKIVLNKTIKDKKFNFKPPKGVQILHASKQVKKTKKSKP